MSFISQKETFEFDLNGYIIFRNFFSSDKILEINAIIDSSEAAMQFPKFGFVNLNPVFLDILSDDRILETCHKWIEPHFRFDHAWGVQHFPGPASFLGDIHGGQFAEQGFFQYHWNVDKPSCTCLIFSIVLEPQRAGEGGLIVLPGSHKSNLHMAGYQILEDILKNNPSNADWVVQPNLKPGDLLIFTEALLHGSAPWKAPDRRRRIIYYKYCLGGMGWFPQDNDDIVELRSKARNKQEELLLRPSYVALRPSYVPQTSTDNSGHRLRTPTYLKMYKVNHANKVKNKIRRIGKRIVRSAQSINGK